MKVLIINEVLGTTSTGRICAEQAVRFETEGHEVKVAYGRWKSVPKAYKKYAIRIGTRIDVLVHVLVSRLFDAHGFGSRLATKRFLKWVDEYRPDLIWMHNLHGYYINIEMLFNWLRQHPDVEKKWTLHDCWAITGHCANFDYVGCDKWMNNCNTCVQKKSYPKSLVDRSTINHKSKREIFNGVQSLRIIVPSRWLATKVERSILNNYPIDIKYNSVDKSVYKFREKESYRKRDTDTRIVLGVANIWNEKKGLYDFYKLAEILGSDYKVVLVGLTKKQIRKLPQNIIGKNRTFDVEELKEFYYEAHVFVNLTYEDNYPLVNIEAQACGTPCITYDTGGCSEGVPKENVVKRGDVYEIARRIVSGDYIKF